MDKIERVTAVMEGRQPDRPPVQLSQPIRVPKLSHWPVRPIPAAGRTDLWLPPKAHNPSACPAE